MRLIDCEVYPALLPLTSSSLLSRIVPIGTSFNPPINPECDRYTLSVAFFPDRWTWIGDVTRT